MSGLIRREDALRCLSSRAGRDLPTTALMLGISMEIAALPAIGTCKDCAYSGVCRNWRGFVECQLGPRQADAPMDTESANYNFFPAHLYVHPDHYCAAFKRRPTDG